MKNHTEQEHLAAVGGEGRKQVAEPTIVGGRPQGKGHPSPGIPHGIEVLVKKASIDPEFRSLLLERRAEAAHEIGLELSPGEIVTLNTVPWPQIELIIEKATVPDEHRRVFLGRIGAAMLALICLPMAAAEEALGQQTDPVESPPPQHRYIRGTRPDGPPYPPKPPSPTGIRPDRPPKPPAPPSNKPVDAETDHGKD